MKCPKTCYSIVSFLARITLRYEPFGMGRLNVKFVVALTAALALFFPQGASSQRSATVGLAVDHVFLTGFSCA